MLGVTGCPNTIHTVTVVSCSDSIVNLDNVVEITGYTLTLYKKGRKELNLKTHTLHRLWLTRGNTALLNPVAPLKSATDTHDNRRFLNSDLYQRGFYNHPARRLVVSSG